MPQPGACADLPDGTYEYGQMGIGTCLAGPNDLKFLDDGRVLAVSNANPWKDFTGGSVGFIDLSTVDWTSGRNVLSPDITTHPDAEGVATRALDMPSFTGPMELAEGHDLLMVANRLSEDARTREDPDTVWYVDVSDPDAPDFVDRGEDGPYTEVGWDPTAIHHDAATDIAYVLNRTSHTVTMLDLGADPVELLPPGGPARLEAGAFDDADVSGSKAGFVTLEATTDTDLVEPGPHAWDLEWAVGTVRIWVPGEGGAYRVTGNGENLWERSNVPLEIDVADSEGEAVAVNDPDFFLDAGYGRMVFEDQGVLRAAGALSDSGDNALESWLFEEDPLLEPGSGWDTEIGGPAMFINGATWYLFYDGGDGGDHAIGLATSADGVTFARPSSAPVYAVDGASVSDPYVVWDPQTNLWRMYYTLDDTSVGEATSEDLETWTTGAAIFAPTGGAWAPAVGYYGGKFHLFYTTAGVDGDVLNEATSLDGSTWTEVGAPFGLDAGSLPAGGGVALQVSQEDTFTLVDQEGTILPTTLDPGGTLVSETGGWTLRVAAGQVADPDDIGMDSLSLGSFDGDVAYLTCTDADEVDAICFGERLGDDLVLSDDRVLEAGAGGAHDADGVSSPVVVEIGGQKVMYYAAKADGVTTIGRATSADGLAWTADASPVLTSSADWESVAMEPGSAQVLDDGTVRLWYTAYDGNRYRIGLATSTDGESFTRIPGTQYDWVLDEGAPGEWYDSGVKQPYVIRDGDTDRLWFAGGDGDTWQIGYAEREGDDAEWQTALDADGSERAVLFSGLGGFGAGGVERPVVLPDGDGWEVWYTGMDDLTGRIGRAVGADPDRLHRDLRLPTLADTWSFTSVPAREGESISLDATLADATVDGPGCSALAEDDVRGFLYVGCKLRPYVFVIDIRDDSTADFEDLNYLDLEAVVVMVTSTGSTSGLRAMQVDPVRGWLWGIADSPEAIYGLDLSDLVDDDVSDVLRENVVTMMPLPRGADEGVTTQSNVGPAQLAMHPDGHHMLVTNFNDNSVSAYDLSLGPTGTLVAQTEAVGENPYAIAISPDGTLAAVANYTGEVEGEATSSTIALLDADPASPTFLQVKTWLVNK